MHSAKAIRPVIASFPLLYLKLWNSVINSKTWWLSSSNIYGHTALQIFGRPVAQKAQARPTSCLLLSPFGFSFSVSFRSIKPFPCLFPSPPACLSPSVSRPICILCIHLPPYLFEQCLAQQRQCTKQLVIAPKTPFCWTKILKTFSRPVPQG